MAHTTYRIEWRRHGSYDTWAIPTDLGGNFGFRGNSFNSYDVALDFAQRYALHYNIVTRVVKVDEYGHAVSDRPGKDTPVDAKPLNVTRTKLIKALKDAQTRIQTEADEQRAKALAAFDERVKLYRENASAAKLNRCLTNEIADGEFVGEKHVAVASDETIDKQVRVLELSEDKTVEVTPTDSFYKHL